MTSSLTVTFDTLRTVAFGSVTNSYVAFGTPFAHQVRMFRITNNTDGDILFSLNGTNDQLFLAAGTFVLYDLCTNRENADSKFVLPQGTQFYIKYSTAPSKNSVYLECIYGRGQ